MVVIVVVVVVAAAAAAAVAVKLNPSVSSRRARYGTSEVQVRKRCVSLTG